VDEAQTRASALKREIYDDALIKPLDHPTLM
jgi:hypothetical protein